MAKPREPNICLIGSRIDHTDESKGRYNSDPLLNNSIPVRLWFPDRRTRFAARVCIASLLIMLTALGFTSALPTKPIKLSSSASSLGTICDPNCNFASGNQTLPPETVGVDQVSGLSFPRTFVSSLDENIAAGRVIQNSADNLTLYNPNVAVGLIGGSSPHDELLGPRGSVLSSQMSWNVQANMTGQWITLVPISNNFTVLGTNSSGTFVSRTMQVAKGSYSGVLRVIYIATSAGPLRWDLNFNSDASSQYRLVYGWDNVTRGSLSGSSKQFVASYNSANYTMSWADASSFNPQPVFAAGTFQLALQLGTVNATSTVSVDPYIISSTSSSIATAFSFQRKIFYEPSGGYYFAFYYDGYTVDLSSSHDGVNWSYQAMPDDWPAFNDTDSSLPSVYNNGRTVVIVVGMGKSDSFSCTSQSPPPCTFFDYVNLYYTQGTVSGESINWGPTQIADQLGKYCLQATIGTCTQTLGIRDVNVGLDAMGRLAFSYNYWDNSGSNGGPCNFGPSESDLIVEYDGQNFFTECSSYPNIIKSVILPYSGGAQVVYEVPSGNGYSFLKSAKFYGSVATLQPLTPSADTYVQSNDDTSHGSSNLLEVGNYSGVVDNAYINFNLPSLPFGERPSKATLSVLLQGGSKDDTTNSMIIGGLSSVWTESTTWSNRPTPSLIYTSKWSLGCGSYGCSTKWVNIDVTPTLLGVYTGASCGQCGISLQMKDPPSYSLYSFSSADAGSANAPTLTISYTCCMQSSIIMDSTMSGDTFSATADSNFGIHVAYQGATDGNVTYAYLAPTSTRWSYSKNIMGLSLIALPYLSSPSLSVDSSTNDLYAFALLNVQGGSQIIMKKKPLLGNWTLSTLSTPIVRSEPMAELGSNSVANGATNSSLLTLLWTEGSGPNYNVTFASIPIQTVWSPFASPADPWDGNGIAPYGQYFSNLGESVSVSTGMLSITQTDLDLPGRGLDLKITRVYTEPFAFMNGNPLNYETYPWAPIGTGWQLDFPWFSNTLYPSYVHLWDGMGYAVPFSFWRGSTASYVNHDGVQFTLARGSDGTISLTTVDGTSYQFDSSHRLITELDSTGRNSITFVYTNNLISCITDTVGRSFALAYTSTLPYLLLSITQSTGNCGAGTVIKQVSYSHDGQTLTMVTDPAGRLTSYQNLAFANAGSIPWFLTKIIYPSGGSTNYSYSLVSLGTEAYAYRVGIQSSYSGNTWNSRIRESTYSYINGAGATVTNTTITTYNGTAYLPSSTTKYYFFFGGVQWTVYNGTSTFLQGHLQLFGVHGEIIQDTTLVSPTTGYSNYYRYDIWGNLIYSRLAINPAYNQYHESFNAYYNNGLSPGFDAFQETFSQNQGNATDNQWQPTNGIWEVINSAYNGTETTGQQESIFSTANIGLSDLSLQASVYVGRQINSSDARVGIFAHNPANSLSKWMLVIHNRTATGEGGSGTYLDLADEFYGGWASLGTSGTVSCPLVYNTWWTFNMTVHGLAVTGAATYPGQSSPCSVSRTFSSNSPAIGGTGFGVYAGGYSALFKDIVATTVAWSITPPGFSNSFISNGAPGPNIHDSVAGSAQLQNGPSSSPMESYYAYNATGEPVTKKLLDNPGPNAQWITTSEVYDAFGNLKSLVDSRGNATMYTYSTLYQSAYLTNVSTILKPGGAAISTSYAYNFTTGYQVSKTDPEGHSTNSTYDILGRVTKTTYPTGDYDSYVYNDVGDYVNSTNEMGWKTTTYYDGLGRLSRATRLLNGIPYSSENYTYNWQDKRSTETDPNGNRITYRYDALGRTTKTIEPNGNITQVFYNDTGSWIRYQDEYGNNRCTVYDRLGRVIEVIEYADTKCNALSLYGYNEYEIYSYDQVGNLLETSATGHNGTVSTEYTYDNLNRLVSTNYADYTSETYTYDNSGNILTKVDRKGTTSQYSYNSLNRILTVKFPGTDTSENYTYDANGNIVELQSQNATIYYSYDSRGRVLSETYAVNPPPADFSISTQSTTVWVAEGSTANFMITLTAGSGFAGTIALSGANLPSGVSISFAPASVSLTPNGVTTIVTTMSATSNAALGTQNGVTVTATSGGLSHSATLTVRVIAGSISFTRSSTLTNITATIGVSLSMNTAMSPTIVGTITRSAINGTNGPSLYSDTIAVQLPLSTSGSSAGSSFFVAEMTTNTPFWFGYACKLDLTHSNGNPSCLLYRTPDINRDGSINIQDQALVAFYFGCSQGQSCYYPKADINADGSIGIVDLAAEAYYMNAAALPPGNFTLSASPSTITLTAGTSGSSTISLSTSSLWVSGNTTVTLSTPTLSDLNVTLSPQSILLGTSASSTLTVATTSLTPSGTYNVTVTGTTPGMIRSISILVTVTNPLPNLICPAPIHMTSSTGSSYTYVVGYCYRGEVLDSLIYPDGTIVKYGYDNLGRTVNATKADSGLPYTSFTYNQDDQVTGVSLGNGLTENYSYDKLSRPTLITVSNNLLSIAYKYNATGTVSSLTGSVNGKTINEQYRYDPLERLTNATVTSNGATTTSWYEYDNFGNRIFQGVNGTITSYTYSDTNELSSACVGLTQTSCSSTNSYSYDGDGNLNASTIGATHWTYTWNPSGQLVKVANNAGTQGVYGYDASGRLVRSTEGTTSMFYAYTGSSTLFQNQVSGAGTDYVFANGLLVAKLVSGSTVDYYHTDVLGSTRLVTDSSGLVVFADGYQPYGLDNGTPTGNEVYRFTGKPVSQTTGLYYYFHRWYDPSTGRFISPDPKQGKLSNPQSLNLYIYVINDPTTLTDPSGLDWWNPFTWSQQQQAQAFSIVVIVVAVVAVVATGGVASPLAAAAIGAALSSTSYTLAAGDKATLAGAVFEAGMGALAGGAGAGVSSLTGNILANAAIGGGVNALTYAGSSIASGHSMTLAGFAGAFISGAVAGGLGAKGIGGGAFGTSFLEKALGNVGIGEVSYISGQEVQGKRLTVGGLLETAGFSIVGGYASDQVHGDFRGATFGDILGGGQNVVDAFSGFGDLMPF